MKKFLTLLTIFLIPSLSFANNSWYYGTPTDISTLSSDGSFMIYTDNPTIVDDCQYSRVSFLVTDMGVERTKAALTMALAAITSGREFGVVIDIQATGGLCVASASASQGAGIR